MAMNGNNNTNDGAVGGGGGGGGGAVGPTTSSSGGGGGGQKLPRGSSYDFLSDIPREDAFNGDESYRFDFNANNNNGNGRVRVAVIEEDPPSKLIGQFLHKQKASGDVCLDMDLDMFELQNDTVAAPPATATATATSTTVAASRSLSPRISESPVHHRVSFDPNPPGSGESVRRRFRESGGESNGGGGGEGEEISKASPRNEKSFSTSSSFKRKSSLLKEKPKSRLMDPATPVGQHQPEKSGRLKSGYVGKSGQLRSGLIGGGGKGGGSVADEDEDDSLLDEDLPHEFTRLKIDKWVILEWVSLILLIAGLVCVLVIPYLRRKELLKLQLWKWDVLVLVLICGRLVSGWVIRIAVFFVERNFLLRKRVLYFVYGVKNAVQNCLWLGLVLIAWHFLFDQRVQRETTTEALTIVTRILVCLVVGTLLWLVKTLVVKVLASSFHVSTYFDRIQESLFNQYVIETLSGPPLIEMKRNAEEEERFAAEVQKLQNAGVFVPANLNASTTQSPQSARVIGSGRLLKSPRIGTPRLSRATSRKGCNGDEGITIDQLHRLTPKNVSAWNMKRLINMIQHGNLSTLYEQIHDSSVGDDESATKIRSEYEAKAAARKIFENVAPPGSRYIYLEDIMRFMPEDEAEKTMSLFEGAPESKKISKKVLKNWVVNAFRERRALALTLNDTKTAVNRLHRLVNAVVGVIILVIWLLMLGIATSKFLVFLSSQVLLVAFIFGNTCKTVFESIIFLFVIHPFDVGDRCEIDGVQMVVEEMNILTTVFLRYDNQKIIITNSVLATKAISNYYRSPDMGDGIEFLIHIATPAEKIALMKQRINSYIENKKEHWYPSPMIICKDFEDINQVRIAVWLTHRMNHQDMGEKFTRRSQLIEEMVKIFKELDIQYRLLPIDINVRALPPVSQERVPPSWMT